MPTMIGEVLRLTERTERLEALQDAADKELAYADFLDLLLTEELASKTAKNITLRTNLARFPFVKSLFLRQTVACLPLASLRVEFFKLKKLGSYTMQLGVFPPQTERASRKIVR